MYKPSEQEMIDTKQTTMLYKSVLSADLVEDLIVFYKEQQTVSVRASGETGVFPDRKKIDDIPEHLSERIFRECLVTLSPYFLELSVSTPRIYGQSYGITRPHRDASLDGQSNYTLLVYLTDQFQGGVLSVKEPRTPGHIDTHGEPSKRHLCYTLEPRTGYGVLFEKSNIHYTDELLCEQDEKIILLLDCAVFAI